MPKYFILLLILLSCTEPHYLDSEIPEPEPIDTIATCQKNGTCTFLSTNKCPYNLTVKVSTADTFYVTELPHDS